MNLAHESVCLFLYVLGVSLDLLALIVVFKQFTNQNLECVVLSNRLLGYWIFTENIHNRIINLLIVNSKIFEKFGIDFFLKISMDVDDKLSIMEI